MVAASRGDCNVSKTYRDPADILGVTTPLIGPGLLESAELKTAVTDDRHWLA